MARVPIKGSVGAGIKPKAMPQHASFVLGSRPAVLRSPSLPRTPSIKPQSANARDYGKMTPNNPFGPMGPGDTSEI